MARPLRAQRSFTIGVVVRDISEGYSAPVLSGTDDYLLEEGYFYFVVSHRHKADLIEEYPRLLQQRAVDGLIAVDTVCPDGVAIPTVAVSGHRHVPGVTNIILNHARAARLALEHLTLLGHRKMAFTLLRRINAPKRTPYPKTITVEPELIARASTAPSLTPV